MAGNNVYPRKVERLMKIYDNVNAVNVYGEDSILQGQLVCVDIKLRNNNMKEQEKFKKWCQKNITSTSLPKKWQFY